MIIENFRAKSRVEAKYHLRKVTCFKFSFFLEVGGGPNYCKGNDLLIDQNRCEDCAQNCEHFPKIKMLLEPKTDCQPERAHLLSREKPLVDCGIFIIKLRTGKLVPIDLIIHF